MKNPLHFASVFIKHYSLCPRWIIVKVNILTRPLIKLYGAILILAPHFHPLWNRIIFITVHLVATVCCCYCGEMGHNKVHSAITWILSLTESRMHCLQMLKIMLQYYVIAICKLPDLILGVFSLLHNHYLKTYKT